MSGTNRAILPSQLPQQEPQGALSLPAASPGSSSISARDVPQPAGAHTSQGAPVTHAETWDHAHPSGFC